MELIVEQLGTTNNVLERQKFDRESVSLGRGFDNDVILTDEHVDARHARLVTDENGRLWIEDLGSVNGIRRPRHKQHLERTEVASGEVFLIGRSRVRVFRSDHPVARAVRIRVSEVFLLWLGKPQVAVLLGLLFVGGKLLETWLSTIGEFRWSRVFERHLGEALTFTAFAVGVYFLSVLFRRGGNFLAHLSLLILLFLVASWFEFAHTVAVFNAGDSVYPVLAWLGEARGYLLLFLYFWSILYLAFHIPLLRRTWISAVVVLVWFGIDHLPEDSLQRFADTRQFPVERAFLPPELLFVEPSPAEASEGRIESLFDELDEARIEALDERAERDAPEDTPESTPDSGGEAEGGDDPENADAPDADGGPLEPAG